MCGLLISRRWNARGVQKSSLLSSGKTPSARKAGITQSLLVDQNNVGSDAENPRNECGEDKYENLWARRKKEAKTRTFAHRVDGRAFHTHSRGIHRSASGTRCDSRRGCADGATFPA